jgi:hypothetical protein
VAFKYNGIGKFNTILSKIILKNNYNEDTNVYKNLEMKTNEFGQ